MNVHIFLHHYTKADQCFCRIPVTFKDTLMYVDHITRQTFDYATLILITCDNNPRNLYSTCRTLSRPPLPVTPNNPLSYKFSRTNAKNIRIYTSLQMNSLSTSQILQLPSTTIRTNPHN